MVKHGDIITFEGVTLYARNFAGDRFGDGRRAFGFFLTPEQAEEMARDGWSVKWTKPPRSEEVPSDWEPRPWLKVNIGYKYRPPKVMQITSRNRTMLDEEAIGMLDWASFQEVDLSIRARFWEMNENSGISAMLHELYVTLEESPLAIKYGAAGNPMDYIPDEDEDE